MRTTTNKSAVKTLFLCFFIFLINFPTYAENSKWVIAAEKFSYSSGYVKDAVSEGSAEMLPMSILEKLSKNIERNILPDEKFFRENNKLRTERQSLYLQLSSEYKKRDSLVLEPLTDKELAVKLKEREKEIEKIKDKIRENLNQVLESQKKSEENMKIVDSGKIESGTRKTEKEIIRNFFHNIFVKDTNIITQEKVDIYRGDYTSLYVPSEKVKGEDKSGKHYLSSAFEKETVSNGINSLITGTITGFGDYLSVTVDLYMYPGAKKIGSITEVGTLQESELITSSIATQLIPLITNAMPVSIQISFLPEETASSAQIYIDDILQSNEGGSITLDSGVHSIQFVADGYRTAGTNYYFAGNNIYNIDVEFQEKVDGFMQIELMKPLKVEGDFLVNGENAQKINSNKSQIKINGTNILGEFITEDGSTAFFYIPENDVFNGNMLKINPKTYDREKNIDKRRKWMYASYSMLMVSLIPTFYTTGNFENQMKLYKDGNLDYSEIKKMQEMGNIFAYVSIGCGAFFAFELFRYLMAANSVLPQKVKKGNISDFEYYEPEIKNEDIIDTTETTDTAE